MCDGLMEDMEVFRTNFLPLFINLCDDKVVNVRIAAAKVLARHFDKKTEASKDPQIQKLYSKLSKDTNQDIHKILYREHTFLDDGYSSGGDSSEHSRSRPRSAISEDLQKSVNNEFSEKGETSEIAEKEEEEPKEEEGVKDDEGVNLTEQIPEAESLSNNTEVEGDENSKKEDIQEPEKPDNEPTPVPEEPQQESQPETVDGKDEGVEVNQTGKSDENSEKFEI